MHRKYQPRTLSDICGQPATKHLKAFVASPQSTCWLLEGPKGTAKTACAQALATELGCHDEFTGRQTVNCTDLGIDRAKELLRHTMRLRYGSDSGFNCLILEEFQLLSPQCQVYLKGGFDPLLELPSRLVVVATSNDSSGLDEALVERFRVLRFRNGDTFQNACRERLTDMLAAEGHNITAPNHWGLTKTGFSMRAAIRHMIEYMDEVEVESVA